MRALKKINYAAFGIVGFVFLCFVAGGLSYVLLVRQRGEEQSARFLNNVTLQRQAALSRQIEADFQVLRGVAIGLSEMDLNDRRKIFNIMATVNRNNGFVRMGLAGTDGKVDLIGLDGSVYDDVDLSANDFFQRALQGQDVVSKAFYEELTGEYVSYCLVPVMKNGRVAAVLCAVNVAGLLRNIISMSVFRGDGTFLVIDSDGTLVIPGVDPNRDFRLGANVFDLFDFSDGSRRAFTEALEKQASAQFSLSIGGQRQSAGMQPLGVNNWFVLSIVPYSSIDAYYKRTSVGISLLIFAACLIFVLLMYRQFRIMAKNRTDLEYLAYTDLLTGARNYPKFLIDAQKILAEYPGRHYAIWSFDVKSFNRVNELYGNSAGDVVIRHIANLFAAEEAKDAVFCRNSADQFTGMRSYGEREELCQWFAGLLDTIAKRDAVAENQVHIDVAMGVYCIDEFHEALSVDNMANRAAVAKKSAKEQTGSGVCFFTYEMGERIRRETLLEATAQEALAQGDIVFFLQPKIGIQAGYRVIGAEALARWRHAEYGWISPAEFIPLFERNGFIVHMDRSIFEQVCQWYAKRMPQNLSGISVSINVSRQALFQEDFVAYYTATKRKYGIGDGLLELEFTESVILDDHELFQNIVVELQDNGFICSIDDFGSGYSSLNVLKNLPIDILKLDALFFRGGRDSKRAEIVVANFIDMAKRLRIKTVAEGVETMAQVAFLEKAGCDMIQGYLFSKPLPPAEFAAFALKTDLKREMP